MWIFYSFLTSFLETAKDVIGKTSSQKTDEYVSAFFFQFFALLFLLPLVISSGIPQLKTGFWASLSIGIILNTTWNILYMKAVKLSPLSVSIPMLAFNPIFTALLSIYFDNKLPSLIGWIGIILVSIGIYFQRLNKATLKKGILHPFKEIKDEPGSLAMLGVALIWSLGAHITKLNVVTSSTTFSAFARTLIPVIILFFITKKKSKFNFKSIKPHLLHLAPLGIVNGISKVTLGKALSLGYTPYVMPVKRTSIVWSSIAGKVLFKEEIKPIKIISLTLIMVGIIFIIL
ncbi:EamA family transporter [Patescibacteria group bacterium]